MAFTLLKNFLKGGLTGWFAKAGPAVELRLGGQRLRFDAPGDFAFALAARTGVTPARIHDWQHRAAADLEEEARGIVALERRLTELRARCEAGAGSYAAALEELGVAVFSKDHDWRVMFAALLERPRAAETYLRVAVDAYLAYLAARRDVLALVRDSRQPAPAMAHAHPTLVFSADQTTAQFERDELRRLPPGEAVTIRLARGASISLKLARHQFSLSHQRGWSLVTDNGKCYTLRPGINSVGRGRDNDVPLDADFRNVSRKHLLAQPLDGDVIVLTDVSAHGTYVPPTALAS